MSKKLSEKEQCKEWVESLPLPIKENLFVHSFIGFFLADEDDDKYFGEMIRYHFYFWRVINGHLPTEKKHPRLCGYKRRLKLAQKDLLRLIRKDKAERSL